MRRVRASVSRPKKPSHVCDGLIVNNMINISCPLSVCTFHPERVISETRVLVEQEGGGEVNTAACYIPRVPEHAQCIKLRTNNSRPRHGRNATERKVKVLFLFLNCCFCAKIQTIVPRCRSESITTASSFEPLCAE